MRRVLIIQAILVLAGVAVSRYHLGDEAMLLALYGGAIALANTLLLQHRVSQAGEVAKLNPQQSILVLYMGVIQRFLFVLIALGVGLMFLFKAQIAVNSQYAVAMIGTFVVAQLAYMLMGAKHDGSQ